MVKPCRAASGQRSKAARLIRQRAEGDLLHGDADGVTSIPLGIASEVADAATEYVAAERLVIDYAQGTMDQTVAGYREAWAAFRAALDDLRRKVRATRG